MIKISKLDSNAINTIFHDKVVEIIDRGFSLDVALRIAHEYMIKLWLNEKESEINLEKK